MKRSNQKMSFRTCILFLLGMLALIPASYASDDQKATTYPAESLELRLNRIAKTHKVEIAYDGRNMKTISVPTTTKRNSAEVDLSNSLSNTNYSYIKVSSESYSVYQDDKKKSSSEKGTITGTVLDKDGFPIPGATIVIVGANNGTATDLKGSFTLKDVPARTYTVEVSCISYQKMRISDVRIAGGKSTPLDVILQDETEQLSEVVVTATYNKATANALYSKQKTMVAMSDGISADLIKKTSDNNVAQVLRRVSGVTVENGKYVTVRGLGERYNNVQLNGSSLPSTEPNRRNFSFDILPTSLIDNVTIAKTFTPDMQGEFTGGLVEVNTLAVPEQMLISVSMGGGFNTNSTGKDFHSTQRLDGDYLFGNSRDWYGTVWKSEISNNMFAGGKTYQELTDNEKKILSEMDSKVPNYWGFRKYKGAPTQNYAITVGVPFDLGNQNMLGVITSLTYRHEENTENLEKGFFISNGDTLVTGKQYKFITTAGAIANIGWERPGHKITWRNLFNNRFTHSNMDRIVWTSDDINQYHMQQYSSPLINRLWQTQLSGEHKLPLDMVFTWMADYSKMNRITPDDRLVDGDIMSDPRPANDDYLINWQLPYYHDLAMGFQMYSKLIETKKNIGGNLEYPFIVQGNKQKLKAGYLGIFRHADYKREYIQTRTISSSSVIPDTYEEGCDVEQVFNPSLYAEGKQYLRTASPAMDRDYYKGPQTIHAAYLMGEFTLWKRLHLTGGVRMEAVNMEATSAYRDNSKQRTIDTTLVNKKTDWLPALTAVYNFTDNFNLRAAYSKTLARPDFRELAIIDYFNVEDRITVRNLGGIRQSYIDNVDVRFEWYPQAGEVISISGFYKKFKDPVELISLKNGNDGKGYTMYTFNLRSASTLGVELNVRKSLDFLAPGSFLKDIYLSGNATLLKGNVEYSVYELIDKVLGNDFQQDLWDEKRNRPLQGLVPYAVNAGLSYSGKHFGAAVNYGSTGRKLMQAGMYEKYDEYEAPRHVLDLQLSAKFLKERLEVKANASDLLNGVYRVYRNCGAEINGTDNDKENTEPDNLYTDRTSLGMNYDEGDWIVNQYKRGTTYSFSVSYNF